MPEPDSPTIASASPARRSKLAPWTAGYQVAVDPEVDVEVAHLDDGRLGGSPTVLACSELSITGASFRRAGPLGWHDGGVPEEVSSAYGRVP